MKGSTLLKVTSILSIIGGTISFIAGIIAIAGLAILIAATGSGLLVLAAIFVLIAAVAELIAGIIGVVNCNKPEKAGVCMAFGIVVIIIALIGNILNIANNNFNFL